MRVRAHNVSGRKIENGEVCVLLPPDPAAESGSTSPLVRAVPAGSGYLVSALERPSSVICAITVADRRKGSLPPGHLLAVDMHDTENHVRRKLEAPALALRAALRKKKLSPGTIRRGTDLFLKQFWAILGVAQAVLDGLRLPGDASADYLTARESSEALAGWCTDAMTTRSGGDPFAALSVPAGIATAAWELARAGARLQHRLQMAGRLVQEEGFVLYLQPPRVVLDGANHPLTEDQARVLERLAAATGAWVPADDLRAVPGSAEDPARIIARLPEEVRALIESKRGRGGGRRLRRLPKVVRVGEQADLR